MIPIITLVLYFNAGEWDGPMSLHDMMAGMEFEVEEEEETVDMCGALKGLLSDAKKEGIQQGMQTIARKMLEEGDVTSEYIARITELSVEEVQALTVEMEN